MSGKTRVVVGGVDTHKDVHVAAVVDPTGKILDTAGLPATAAGYRELLGWMRGFGEVARVGVEGTGAYGAGLARLLAAEGVLAVEVNRPNRQARRRRGKSDTVDAEAAARAALNGEATVAPKTQGGIVESIRVLRVAFTSARNSRTRVALQIRDLIVTAPDALRAVLGPLATAERVARWPGSSAPVTSATRSLGPRSPFARSPGATRRAAPRWPSSSRASTGSRPGPTQHSGARRGSAPTSRPSSHRGGRQPRAAEVKRCLGRDVRRLSGRGVLGQDGAPPAQPRRQPPSQPRPVAHRHGPAHL